MLWFVFLALGALVLPALAYYLWCLFMPPRFGGIPALARGEWRPLPWRWLLPVGVVLFVAVVVSFVSISAAPPLPGAVPAAPVAGKAADR
jgi:hypothetical protein